MESNETTYQNPYHADGYGPANYTTTARGKAYRGYLIFERIPGKVWDVVKDGVVVTQRAGPRGAREAIDLRLDLEVAQALGFESVAAMNEHGEWLMKNGTREFKRWLAEILMIDKEAQC